MATGWTHLDVIAAHLSGGEWHRYLLPRDLVPKAVIRAIEVEGRACFGRNGRIFSEPDDADNALVDLLDGECEPPVQPFMSYNVEAELPTVCAGRIVSVQLILD